MKNSYIGTKSKNNILLRNIVITLTVVFLSLIIYLAFFLHARVNIAVSPTNAIVTIDNKPMEVRNGKSSFPATLGKHIIKVEADDYIGYKEEIILKRGRNYSKKITLTKAPTPIEITANATNISINGNEVFYQNNEDHLIYRATIEQDQSGLAKIKNNQTITSKPITNVDKIIWSPNKDLILLKRGKTVSLFDFKKYDFVNQQETLFGNDIGDIVWSPDNSRIAYYYEPPSGERSIIFADKTNETKYRVVNLIELGINNPYLAFSPNSEWLVMIPRNRNYNENNIYLINVFTKTIKKINNSGEQKEAIFTSDSQRIIYSTYSTDKNNPYNQTLSIMNLDGSDKRSLKLAGKASDIRYWNDPNKIFLLRNGENSKLLLYNINNGDIIDFYFRGQSDSEISEIFLNEDKSGAVFVSKGKLYYIKLEGNG